MGELVGEAATRIAALPAPKNGQVRAVPDDRTIRYYGTIGLLERPLAMRGRTALYGRRHLAQVVAIKRLQAIGRSLAEIQALWPTLDDVSLARMSGVALAATPVRPTSRAAFWKREPIATTSPSSQSLPITQPRIVVPPASMPAPVDETGQPVAPPAVELRIQLAFGITLSLAVPDGIALNPAEVDALREAAAPLVGLASRLLGSQPGGDQ
ncbi:MAG: MerR family transcriptional regulator [Deltaproteobacteria bacterium]|nr:MerR family transcriptional regulator [Deltaproteobacteria bacterium]